MPCCDPQGHVRLIPSCEALLASERGTRQDLGKSSERSQLWGNGVTTNYRHRSLSAVYAVYIKEENNYEFPRQEHLHMNDAGPADPSGDRVQGSYEPDDVDAI